MTKSVLITGAASGIGLAAAKRFHAEGWLVGLLDVDEEALRRCSEELGGAWFHAFDVRDAEEAAIAVTAFAESNQGKLDLLLNSAGVLTMGSFTDVDWAAHQRTIDINVNGVMNMCYQAFPYLKSTKAARVINMSSASAIYGIPKLASYSASKFAIRGFTEALNIEWKEYDVRVCDTMPLFVNTPMVNEQEYKTPALSRMGVNLTADDIAQNIWESANAKTLKTHYPTSNLLKVSMRFISLLPDSLARMSVKWLNH